MSAEEFKNRLGAVIQSEKSLNDFANKCGITGSLMRNYLYGKSLPGLDKLILLSNVAGVEIKWLATGEGPMKRGEEPKKTPGHIDEELLEAVIEEVEELLKTIDKPTTPKQKTQLILALYDVASEREDHAIDRPTTLRLVKLMAA